MFRPSRRLYYRTRRKRRGGGGSVLRSRDPLITYDVLDSIGKGSSGSVHRVKRVGSVESDHLAKPVVMNDHEYQMMMALQPQCGSLDFKCMVDLATDETSHTKYMITKYQSSYMLLR
jgi:hypothetical protein